MNDKIDKSEICIKKSDQKNIMVELTTEELNQVSGGGWSAGSHIHISSNRSDCSVGYHW